MPANCSYEQASIVEPLSVALHASRRAPASPGQSVLIFGAGPMGILQCAVAKAQGAAKVCIVDIDERRVGFATREGFATMGHVLEKSKGGLEKAKEVAGVLVGMLGEGKDGFDVVYECSGVESCVQAGIYVGFILFRFLLLTDICVCVCVGRSSVWEGGDYWDGCYCCDFVRCFFFSLRVGMLIRGLLDRSRLLRSARWILSVLCASGMSTISDFLSVNEVVCDS